MSALIDQDDLRTERARAEDARLEAQIDAAYEAMVKAPTDAESKAWFTEMNVLIGRRSRTAIMKLELERRARNRKQS